MIEDLQLTDLRRIAEDFEDLITKALEDKYPSMLFDGGRMSGIPIFDWNVKSLLEMYIRAEGYPNERAAKFLFKSIDFKLQIYFLHESDIGLYNSLYFDEIARSVELNGEPTPRLLLRRLSFDQNLIGKARVLWERLMNMIYFLETGRELEDKKSKKTAFFRWTREQAPRKWLFMSAYEDMLTSHDQRFRTPEFHKNSVLRAELLGQKSIDMNDLLRPINYAQNAIRENLMNILNGQWPNCFTDVHMIEGDPHKIDPKYLGPDE